MKPILIIEHIASSGPGLFRTFIEERSIPYSIVRPNNGEVIPGINDISNYSGLCICGGVESVMQPPEWLNKEVDLVRAAREIAMPVIGHCLGGQVICKALGGDITLHEHQEFGWSKLIIEHNAQSSEWLKGPPSELFAMQWHTDTFTIPEGATRILTGDYCQNQAFVYENMLAMQFHVEVDVETINHWAVDLADKHPEASKSVQTGEQVKQDFEINYAKSSQLAKILYTRWIEELVL
jgi:GMP synthase-like glutamine amidotransferase